MPFSPGTAGAIENHLRIRPQLPASLFGGFSHLHGNTLRLQIITSNNNRESLSYFIPVISIIKDNA